MKPLVLGGTGFIGYNLVKALKSKGYDVRCSRRESSNTILLRKLKPEMVFADLEDIVSLKQAMKGCDTVFLAAAYYPRYSVHLKKQVDYAVKTVQNVLQAASDSNIRTFIYTSSVTTVKYLGGNAFATEKDGIGKPPGHSVYFAVKYAMEKEVMLALDKGLPGSIMCVAGCLGPADIKMGTGFFIVESVNGTLKSYIDGKINIIDVEDVAETLIAAATKDTIAKRYIVGHHNITVSKLLNIIAARFAVSKPSKEIPLWIGYPLTKFREYKGHFQKKRMGIPLEFVDMLRFGQHYDCSKAKSELYNTATPIEVTLDKSYEWFKKYKYIKS